MSEYVVCPFCGKEIKKDAKACRYCGSDEETGWADNEYSESLGADDGFDYDEMVEVEFGNDESRGVSSKKKVTLQRVTTIILLALIVIILLNRLGLF